MKLPVPEGLNLLPHQIKGVHQMISFMTSPTKGVYCADEQGLGKTIQAIIAFNTLSCRKVLIVCPAVMRHTWKKELESWSKFQGKIRVITKKHEVGGITPIDNFIVVSYNLCASEEAAKTLGKINWDCLILDESHLIKNYKAKRTKAILTHIWPKAEYHIALSGTPFTNHVVDGYTLFSKFLPGQWPSYLDFAGRYAYARNNGFAIVYEGLRRERAPELSKLIRDNFYFRRVKSDVLKDLPDKRFQRIVLGSEFLYKGDKREITDLQREMDMLLARLENDAALPPMTETVAGLRRMQGELKVPAVIEFATNMLENDIPVVLFGYHTNTIKLITEGLKKFNPVVIQGSTPDKLRKSAVEDFQEGKTNLFIGQLTAAGVGITLTRASNVILAELDWTPNVISQAVDRCHRIGQKSSVNVYYFIVEKSIEEDIIEAVIKKAQAHAQIIEN